MNANRSFCGKCLGTGIATMLFSSMGSRTASTISTRTESLGLKGDTIIEACTIVEDIFQMSETCTSEIFYLPEDLRVR